MGKATPEYNLAVINLKVAKEWHPTKNKPLTPKEVTPGSGKKVWWICKKGHEWDAQIGNRTNRNRPTGCPECLGKKVGQDNNLKVLYPRIAKEWHPTKNGELKPKDITSGVGNKVWWKCNKGHEWIASVDNRTKGRGCPQCSNKIVGQDNNLKVLYPRIAKEWHPTRNGDLTPRDFVGGSSKKIWWKCVKGHEWKTVIYSRTTIRGTGCPMCSHQTSKPEIRIYSEMKCIFNDVKLRHKVDGVEIDIFMPLHNLGIEYDGAYFHAEKIDKDLTKTKFIENRNINFFRVRHSPLKPLSINDIVVFSDELTKNDLNNILITTKEFVGIKESQKIDKYLIRNTFVNDALFKKYVSYFPSPFPEKSLSFTHSSLVEEWDYDKNFPLTPVNFVGGSGHKVWWVCNKGHKWESTIDNRTKKIKPQGCPECSNKKVGNDNNLKVLYPKIAKEWHPTKNGCLTPKSFVAGSHKKVWWRCKKGHEWDAVIKSRVRGSGCPECCNQKVGKDNNLKVLYPEIAKELHPTKNGDLTPRDFVGGSSKKVWWKCIKGHEWDAQIHSRSIGSGCPHCFKDRWKS